MKMLLRNLFLVSIFIVHSSLLGNKNILEGRVVSVYDGDTFTLLLEDNKQEKIRLQDIDAPELGQAFGKKAKKALSDMIYMKSVKVFWEKRDRNKRIIGDVRVGNIRVNEQMIDLGYAWQYLEYKNSDHLKSIQHNASKKRLGLWLDKNPIAPWEWRKMRKSLNKK
jgi:endonuclease YncB( thermonuclease family)